MRIVIITGINKGLGHAFFELIRKEMDFFILAISRRLNPQQERNISNYKNVIYVQKDLSEEENMDFIPASILWRDFEEIIFINNAASITPIGRIGTFSNLEIKKIINLNTMIPFMLTNYLLQKGTSSKIKIINISSGAAKRPIEGWGLYCATKGANEMFFDVLKSEVSTNVNFSVYNIDPGVMNTEMQEEIRSKSQTEFPNVTDFIQLSKENKLRNVNDVAYKILKDFAVL